MKSILIFCFVYLSLSTGLLWETSFCSYEKAETFRILRLMDADRRLEINYTEVKGTQLSVLKPWQVLLILSFYEWSKFLSFVLFSCPSQLFSSAILRAICVKKPNYFGYWGLWLQVGDWKRVTLKFKKLSTVI